LGKKGGKDQKGSGVGLWPEVSGIFKVERIGKAIGRGKQI